MARGKKPSGKKGSGNGNGGNKRRSRNPATDGFSFDGIRKDRQEERRVRTAGAPVAQRLAEIQSRLSLRLKSDFVGPLTFTKKVNGKGFEDQYWHSMMEVKLTPLGDNPRNFNEFRDAGVSAQITLIDEGWDGTTADGTQLMDNRTGRPRYRDPEPTFSFLIKKGKLYAGVPGKWNLIPMDGNMDLRFRDARILSDWLRYLYFAVSDVQKAVFDHYAMKALWEEEQGGKEVSNESVQLAQVIDSSESTEEDTTQVSDPDDDGDEDPTDPPEPTGSKQDTSTSKVTGTATVKKTKRSATKSASTPVAPVVNMDEYAHLTIEDASEEEVDEAMRNVRGLPPASAEDLENFRKKVASSRR